MTEQELKTRTKRFGLAVVRLAATLPRTVAADTLARQLIRSGTSIGANYRAACRAKSNADFVAKLAIVEEEADESCYWLELLKEAGLVQPKTAEELWNECNEITAIIVASIKTARRSPAYVRPRGSSIQNPNSKIQNGNALCRQT